MARFKPVFGDLIATTSKPRKRCRLSLFVVLCFVKVAPCLSLWLPGSLSVSVCSPPFPVVSITTSIPLSACVFYYLYVCLSVCLLNYPFVRIYLCCPLYPFDKICLTIPLSVCLPVFFLYHKFKIHSSVFIAFSICWSV